MRQSKRHQAEVDLMVAKMTTPFAKSLKKRPKSEIYPAYLPLGVGTHGNTTGNVAEVSHRVFDAVRGQLSLYKSLRMAVEVMHRRSEALRGEYVQQAAHASGLQPFEVSLESRALDDLMIPAVHSEIRKQSQAAMSLASCTTNAQVDGQAQTFTVQDRDENFVVTPSDLLESKWESACGCRKNANVPNFCKHIQRVLADSKGDSKFYVKDWQRPEAWRQQTTVVWAPPGAREAVEGVRRLYELCQVPAPIATRTRTRELT